VEVVRLREVVVNRRDFLRLGGMLCAAAYASPVTRLVKLSPETAALGKLYRGTYDGDVQVSQDGGRSWKLHYRFGPDCPILDIYTGPDGRLYLCAGFKQHTFQLMLSRNEKAWLSRPLAAAVRTI
jgi:hypothetical protein